MSDQPEPTLGQKVAAAASNAAFQLGIMAGALMRAEKEGGQEYLEQARAAYARADEHMLAVDELMDQLPRG